MAEEIYQVLGRNIRERRLARQWSLAQLAVRLGVSYQQLQKYEKGANRLPTHMLATLAAEFGCTTDELCGLAPAPASPEAARISAGLRRVKSPELRRRIAELVEAAATLQPE